MTLRIGWGWRVVIAGWCVLALAGASRAAAEKASDWPQFRGPGGQGVSSDVGLPVTWGEDDGVVWKAPLPGAGTSSPVVVGPRR